MYEMATTTIVPNQHRRHQSFHLEVIGEEEKTEFDGSYPGSELVTEITHTEVL
jgi:hypothetical protein